MEKFDQRGKRCGTNARFALHWHWLAAQQYVPPFGTCFRLAPRSASLTHILCGLRRICRFVKEDAKKGFTRSQGPYSERTGNGWRGHGCGRNKTIRVYTFHTHPPHTRTRTGCSKKKKHHPHSTSCLWPKCAIQHQRAGNCKYLDTVSMSANIGLQKLVVFFSAFRLNVPIKQWSSEQSETGSGRHRTRQFTVGNNGTSLDERLFKPFNGKFELFGPLIYGTV